MIKVTNLSKTFETREGERIVALQDVSVTIPKGSVVAVLGLSGSGKSTFLRCLNGLILPSEGEVKVNDTVLHSTQSMHHLRKEVGMVFQQFNLFPDKTVLENIILAPMVVQKMSLVEASALAVQLLKRVGLENKINAYPAELSGGQKQRVAIARALAMKPKIMLFDEPTSALDPIMTEEVMAVIRELADHQMTLVIVTHELAFAEMIADKILFFDHGRLIADEETKSFFHQATQPRIRQFLETHSSQDSSKN